MTSTQSTTIRFLCWNVQSIVSKIHEVLQVLSDEETDIACIQETWLSQEHSATTGIIKQAGYDITHVYRDKRGAGVAVLHKHNLKSLVGKCVIKEKCFVSFQYQCLIINCKPKLLVISIYRLQEISMNVFTQELDDLISSHSTLTHSIILVGDFNVHYEIIDKNDTVSLANVTSSFGLAQHVVGPTHKRGHTLDLAFFNPFELQVSVSPVIDIGLGDHFPIKFHVNIANLQRTPDRKQVTYRNIGGIDFEEFESDLMSNFQQHFLKEDLDFRAKCELYTQICNSTLDKFAPLQTKTVFTKSYVPWHDEEYKTERALRRKLERNWKKSKSKLGPERTAYIQQRKKCAGLSAIKRSQYYTHIIDNSDGDQKCVMKIVSEILDKNKSSGIFPHFENPVNLANKFNRFYVEKVMKIRDEIPNISSSDVTVTEFFSGQTLNHFQLTTVEELSIIVKEGELKTAFCDVIPKALMKKSIDILLPYICELINTSLSTGSIEGVKESTIMPILKKSGLDPEVLKNYRPVSDIMLISKLTEKVVLRRLNAHSSNNNLNCNFQHGYKKMHSTETLLLRLVDDILTGYENNSATVLVLLDLSAAFDTVDLKKLLYILENEMGIKDTASKWFQSFLIGRTQRVRINQTLSESLNVSFGVPQGSVLGPVLFNIYIRSLYNIIVSAGFSTSGYADDNNARKTFALSFQYNIITNQVPALIGQISTWMNAFFLKINPDKTEIILFTPKSNKLFTINGILLDNGECVRFSKSVKNLGFHLDSILNMDTHVNLMVSHCYKLLKDIRSIRNLISHKQTEMLVHSIVTSRLDYCNSLFYGVNQAVIYKMQKVQNAAARLVMKRRKFDSVRMDIYNLHWLRVEQRIIFKLLITTYKCLHEQAPLSIRELIVVKDHNTLQHIFRDTKYGRRAFSYIAPRLWNKLPIEMRNARSLETFKSKIKTFLFTNFPTYMINVRGYNTM